MVTALENRRIFMQLENEKQIGQQIAFYREKSQLTQQNVAVITGLRRIKLAY